MLDSYFSKDTARKFLERHNIIQKKDCSNGYTGYKLKNTKGQKSVLHIGWNLTPIPVYVNDPKREIKMEFNRTGRLGRSKIGEGQEVARVIDNLTSINDLQWIKDLVLSKNIIPRKDLLLTI